MHCKRVYSGWWHPGGSLMSKTISFPSGHQFAVQPWKRLHKEVQHNFRRMIWYKNKIRATYQTSRCKECGILWKLKESEAYTHEEIKECETKTIIRTWQYWLHAQKSTNIYLWMKEHNISSFQLCHIILFSFFIFHDAMLMAAKLENFRFVTFHRKNFRIKTIFALNNFRRIELLAWMDIYYTI